MDRRRGIVPSLSSRSGSHRAPRSTAPGRSLGWTALALGALAIALVALLLVRPWAVDPADRAIEADQSGEVEQPGEADRAGKPAGNAAATEVLNWTAAELEPGTTVRVPDEVLADALAGSAGAGADGGAARFDGSPADSGDAGDSLYLLTDEPPAGALVLAGFPGPEGTVLTLVDPRPGRPTPAELERRQRLSQAILANPSTGATGRTAEVLEQGHVDARLLGLLAALATRLESSILDLPPAEGAPAGAGPAEGPLIRTAVIHQVDGRPVPADPSATQRLLDFLDAQRPPYAPHTVEVTDEGVRLAFRYESAPDALVTQHTP